MRRLAQSLLVLSFSIAAPVATSAARGGEAASYGREAYRANLVGCIARAASCDRDALSQIDRDYLTYELRDQRFSPAIVQQVADVRMQVYGREVTPVMGRATGTRYSNTAPASDPAAAPSGGGASQIIGLTKGIADVALPLLKQMGTATN